MELPTMELQIFAPLIAGAIVPLIVQYAKRRKLNPRTTLLVISVLLAGVWSVLHYGGAMDYALRVLQYMLEIAGMASLVYTFLKAYFPSIKS